MKSPSIIGLMLDMVRVTERYEHYLDVARSARGWGYNTIFAHLTDDSGCAMCFQSRPELATPHALSREQVEQWIDTAEEHGVSIVPEIECFGHTKFIHGLRKHKHLAVRTTGHFNAIHPMHPDTHAVIGDLLREAAVVFDSPYIHAGFDEVNLGDGAALGPGSVGKQPWEIFAEYVNWVHGVITGLGKQMMIWGDHLISDPRIGERVPKDIIVCDWQYHPDLNGQTTRSLLEMGFRVVCCPSSSRSGDMVMPRSNTMGNLQRFSRIAHEAGEGVLGLMNTVWCPGRMLCDLERFALALGGAWFHDPEADPAPVVAGFAEAYFGVGVDASKRLAEAIIRLSTLMPHNSLPRRIMQTETSANAPAPPVTASEAWLMKEAARAIESIRSDLATLRTKATCNKHAYDNLLLACDLVAWWDRLAQARLRSGHTRVPDELVNEGRRLLEGCLDDWSRRRFEDDPNRDHDTYPEADGLVTNLTRSLAEMRSPV